MSAKHTPGPWVANGAYVFAGKGCIAVCDTDNASPARYVANARLIAAAPDLLNACNEAFDVLGGVDGAAEVRDALLAALQKAEGRS